MVCMPHGVYLDKFAGFARQVQLLLIGIVLCDYLFLFGQTGMGVKKWKWKWKERQILYVRRRAFSSFSLYLVLFFHVRVLFFIGKARWG